MVDKDELEPSTLNLKPSWRSHVPSTSGDVHPRFNGDPGDWTDGGFRQYLVEHGGLDPELVRVFRYGVAEDGTYNNRGDLRQISSRLAGVGLSDAEKLTCSVDQLSADSAARGGPAQVTLIAHSLGGIISRYYLSRQRAG